MASCVKSNVNVAATLVKDCTGVYLRINNKDYHVCNTELTANMASGTPVLVSFTKIDACTGTASNAIVCMMLHDNEGWVTINSIK